MAGSWFQSLINLRINMWLRQFLDLTSQLNTFGQWQWLDNSPTFFFDWDVNEPAYGAQCASIYKNNSYLKALECNSYVLPFICIYDPATSSQSSCPTQLAVTSTPKVCPVRCDEGWTYFAQSNSCYRTYWQRTWANAEQLCVSLGGHLVSIHSLDENNFVINLSKTGMNNDPNNNQVAIGATKACPQCNVTWSDGSPFDWNNWGPQEPYYGPDLCSFLCADEAQMVRGEWQTLWAMVPCTWAYRALVCKKPANS